MTCFAIYLMQNVVKSRILWYCDNNISRRGNIMKKMIAFMLACCVAFGATACSNTNTNKPEPAKQEETQDNANNTEIQEYCR